MNALYSTATRPVALVVGATGGLGQAYCRELARRKIDLILAGRSEAALRALGNELQDQFGIRAKIQIADLCEEDDIQNLILELDRNEALTWLVNAAGLAQWSRFREATSSDEQAMFQINLLTPIRLARAAIEAFERRGGGHVVQFASAAAFFSMPFLSGYCASKTAMVRWLISIRQEGLPNSVRVQALCPGFVKTEMFLKAGANAEQLPRWIWMSPERVVDESLHALGKNQTVCIPGRRYRWMIFGLKFFPSSLSARVAGSMFGNFSKYRLQSSTNA